MDKYGATPRLWIILTTWSLGPGQNRWAGCRAHRDYRGCRDSVDSVTTVDTVHPLDAVYVMPACAPHPVTLSCDSVTTFFYHPFIWKRRVQYKL